MSWKRIVLASAAVVAGGAALFAVTPLGRDLLFHAVPMRWTGEATRLAVALNVGPGSVIADVGAGSGALAVELAALVGPAGRTFATERLPEQRQRISDRAASAEVAVTVVEAADTATGLPDACCDVITMRMVMHHIGDPAAFARDLRRSLRPGGRVGVVDFAAGALPHLAHDHGVSPERIIEAFTAAGFAVVQQHPNWSGRTYLLVFTAPRAG